MTDGRRKLGRVYVTFVNRLLWSYSSSYPEMKSAHHINVFLHWAVWSRAPLALFYRSVHLSPFCVRPCCGAQRKKLPVLQPRTKPCFLYQMVFEKQQGFLMILLKESDRWERCRATCIRVFFCPWVLVLKSSTLRTHRSYLNFSPAPMLLIFWASEMSTMPFLRNTAQRW